MTNITLQLLQYNLSSDKLVISTKGHTAPNNREDTHIMAKTENTEKVAPKGTKWLTDLVNEKLGTSYTSYQLRILLRKLTKEGVIEREEGNYIFKGERDPRVVAVLKAVKAGAMEAETKARTSKAKKAVADDEVEEKPRRTRAKKAAPVEDDEDDEEEEAPKPARRSRAKAKPKPVEEVEDEDEDFDLDEI